jgi:hypothetical protein
MTDKQIDDADDLVRMADISLGSVKRGVGHALALAIQPLRERLEALEKRAEALEQRRFEYCGVWKHGETYLRGQFVTHQGCLFHCNETTMDVPATSSAWQLCVKRGKPGRDAK